MLRTILLSLKAVGKGLARARVRIPSSLATMLLWLGGLKAMETWDEGPARAEAVVSAMQPAVTFLGRWMTLFLTPPLTMLPTAIKANAKGTTAEQWRRLLAIHAGGWALSCVVSASIARALSGRCNPQDSVMEASPSGALAAASAAGD